MTIEQFLAHDIDTRRILIHTMIADAKEKNSNLNAVIRREDTRVTDHIEDQLTKPLGGLPLVIKDNILLEGTISTACSAMLEDYVAPYTASALQHLIDQGALIIAKANMDEFAMGASNETSVYGPARNPYHTDRIPGGSSGGSAAALAAGMTPIALGTDTGGSVRQPAALCGTIGRKPSYGRYSRYGLIAMASSFDQLGVFGHTVDDVRKIDTILAHHDPRDATSVAYTHTSYPSDRTLRLALPRQYCSDTLDPQIAEKLGQHYDTLRAAGHTVDTVDIPLLDVAVSIYYTLITSEVSTNMARYDGIRYGQQGDTFSSESIDEYIRTTRSGGLGSEVQQRILTGTYVLNSEHYDGYVLQAQRVRHLLRQQVEGIMADYDAIIGPTTPTTARPIGEKIDDPIAMYLADIYTVTANLVAAPAISLPAGMIDGLPCGLQLMGAIGQDEALLDIAQMVSDHISKP